MAGRRIRDQVPLGNRITYNRVELACVTGCAVEIVDEWIHEGIPCFKQKRMYVFERESAIQWLRQKALMRQGLQKKGDYDEIFPGIELT